MIKRFISLTVALIIIALPLCIFVSCDTAIGGDVKTLYVYNWGEYISDGSEGCLDSNRAFELWYEYKYGEKINVVYSTYSSNEDMYAKLSGGAVSYDIIVPSDYMIERLIKGEDGESLLAPLNKENIPHIDNLSSDFYGDGAKYDYYDEGSVYSIPYFYGMIGIIYNPQILFDNDSEIPDEDQSWKIMWNPDHKGNILQFNNSRDAFGTAQYMLGIDVNTDDENQWRKALNALKEQKGIVQGYVMDEIFNKMEGGSAGIAAYYAGDYLTMYENSSTDEKPSDLKFFYPKEGTNLYVDAMCIPATSQNKELAEAYIDFMLMVDEDFEEEAPDFYEFYSERMGGEEFYSAAVANAEYTYYASPNQKVVDDESYRESMDSIREGAFDLMYDKEALANATYYKNLTPEKLALINTLWEELKSDIDVSPVIIIICVAIIGVIGIGGLLLGLRKRYRNNY
jgi:spermidine/putrescine transport system substrate-binding protein